MHNFFQPFVDKIRDKLTSWKRKLLCMMRRTQLVNVVIVSLLSYNFQVYKCLIKLLKVNNGFKILFVLGIHTNDNHSLLNYLSCVILR